MATSKNAILNVFSIPELHEHICHHLNPHDFVACVQVNKTFCALFLPFLWHTVNLPSIEDTSTDRFIHTSGRFLSHDGRAVTTRNGHLIKSFKTEDPGLVVVLPDSCINLYRLCIGDRLRFERATTDRPSVTPEALAVMGRNLGVKRFRMDTIDSDISDFMDTVVRSFPILESLTIGLKDSQFAHLVKPGGFFDNCPPKLRKLTLKFYEDRPSTSVDFSDERVSLATQQQYRSPVPITTLKLERCKTFNNLPLINMIRRLASLETLHLNSQAFDAPQVFAEVLTRYCPQLVHLNLFTSSCYNDNYVMSLFGASTGWRTIKAPYSFHISPLSFRLLLDHSTSTLEHFVYERNSGIGETEAHQLLTRFGNLKIFALDLWCNVAAMIQSPSWACARSLATFRIVINNIPRPDIKENHNKRPLVEEPLHQGTMDESRKIQKQLYARLGTLTQLEYLILGTDFCEYHWADNREGQYTNDIGVNVNGYQYECLDFTLESGLAEMAGLKKLKVLDVTRMSHRIRVPELEWMTKNWPRLETIIGLFPHGDTPDPEVEAWLQDNNYASLQYEFSHEKDHRHPHINNGIESIVHRS